MNRRLASSFSLLILVFAAMAAATACGGPPPPPQAPGTEAPPPVAQQAAPPTAAPPVATPEQKPPVAEPEKPPVETPAKPSKKVSEPAKEETAGAKTAAPAAVPAPVAEPVTKTLAAGTEVEIAFLDGVSSKASHVGDAFRTRVTKDVVQDGVVVIPAGSVVAGSVTEAVPLKTIGGQAKLALAFSTLELPSGRTVPITASFAEAGKKETGRDAATIGGATAGGALLGRILSKDDKSKGTVIGAIVGAAAGTVIASKTKGEEIEVPSGSVITLKLDHAVQFTVRP
jgi:hypothetical protein